jgi:hypothetical protein
MTEYICKYKRKEVIGKDLRKGDALHVERKMFYVYY